MFRMVCTRARHRKETQQNINQVKRFLGEATEEEPDEREEDEHSRADSPSPERDSKDPDWNPYGGITKRRPERKRKPAAKKTPTKKSKKPRKNENSDEYKAPTKRRKKTSPPQKDEDVESPQTTRATTKKKKLPDIPAPNETIPAAQKPSTLDPKLKRKPSISFEDAINSTEKTPSVPESSAKEKKTKKKHKRSKSESRSAREKAEAEKKQLNKKKKRGVEFQREKIVCHYCSESLYEHEDERRNAEHPEDVTGLVETHLAHQHNPFPRSLGRKPIFTCSSCKEKFETADEAATHNLYHRKTSLLELKTKYNLCESDLDNYPKLFTPEDYLYRLTGEGDEMAEGVLHKIERFLIPNNSKRSTPKWPEFKLFDGIRYYEKSVVDSAFFLRADFDPELLSIQTHEETNEDGETEVYYNQGDFQLYVQDFIYPPAQIILTFDDESLEATMDSKRWIESVKTELEDEDYDVPNAMSGVIFDTDTEDEDDEIPLNLHPEIVSSVPGTSSTFENALDVSMSSNDTMDSTDIMKDLEEIEREEKSATSDLSQEEEDEEFSDGDSDDVIFNGSYMADFGFIPQNNNVQPFKYRPQRRKRSEQ